MNLEIGKYRKLIAAVLGVGILVAAKHFQLEIPGLAPIVIDVLIGALTSFGVYQAKNDE